MFMGNDSLTKTSEREILEKSGYRFLVPSYEETKSQLCISLVVS